MAVRVVEAGTVGPDGAPTTVVAVSGHLDLAGARRLTGELARLLRAHGRVIADVSGVVPGHSAAAGVFTRALEEAGGWPDAALVLAAPSPGLAAFLRGSRTDDRVPVRPDVPAARVRVGERPPVVRGWWRFPVDPHAPGAARSRVRRACAGWDVEDDAREAAEIVVTELVTNAVEHAASPAVVVVTRDDGTLRLAVRDFDTAPLPDVRLPGPESARGRGLAMVAALSQAWGVCPHGDGKTIWSELPV